MAEAVMPLRVRVDAAWLEFNFFKAAATSDERIIEGLNLAATAPFGMGDRLTWLADVPVGQRCGEALLAELERTLPQLPANSHLLFTAKTKPDGRLKAVKLLQNGPPFRSFRPFRPGIRTRSRRRWFGGPRPRGFNSREGRQEALVEAIGGDLRRMATELAKLHLYAGERPVTAADVQGLVFSGAARYGS
ncbi:MAG: hypothetical protein HC918_03085 [Oscillatoriales cyanobacterium SM2_1_8]|nr:hypothetical protein [Oscillatoriales cyanobacterium SM2_1_8]